MIDKILTDLRPKMQSIVDNLRGELKNIRTGRAHASIVDSIRVPYYGSQTPLREVATVTVPESNVVSIKPWDRDLLGAIETSIRESDLNLAPVNDGSAVRLVLPPMTEDRRKEIVDQAKKLGEQTKVALRGARSEAWSTIQEAVKNKQATEDDKYRSEERLNKMIDEINKEVDKIVADKEKEILTI